MGQDEIEIARAADVVAVVLVPGMGDDIQAIKAGILEIADLFVINKADRPGADRVQTDLEYVMSLAPSAAGARPEIFRTVAVRDEGIDLLKEGIARYAGGAGNARRARRRRERAEMRLQAILAERLLRRVREGVLSGNAWGETLDAIAEGRIDPYTAADRVLERVEVR